MATAKEFFRAYVKDAAQPVRRAAERMFDADMHRGEGMFSLYISYFTDVLQRQGCFGYFRYDTIESSPFEMPFMLDDPTAGITRRNPQDSYAAAFARETHSFIEFLFDLAQPFAEAADTSHNSGAQSSHSAFVSHWERLRAFTDRFGAGLPLMAQNDRCGFVVACTAYVERFFGRSGNTSNFPEWLPERVIIEGRSITVVQCFDRVRGAWLRARDELCERLEVLPEADIFSGQRWSLSMSDWSYPGGPEWVQLGRVSQAGSTAVATINRTDEGYVMTDGQEDPALTISLTSLTETLNGVLRRAIEARSSLRH